MLHNCLKCFMAEVGKEIFTLAEWGASVGSTGFLCSW